MVKLKIMEFKRIMRGNSVQVASKSKSKPRGKVKQPLYKTPLRSTQKKAKKVSNRSNSSRKTLDDTFKYDCDTETNYLDSNKADLIAANILSEEVVEEAEDDYGSDFEQSMSPKKRQETTNVNLVQPKQSLQHTAEVKQEDTMSGIAANSHHTPQLKVSSKPNFMLKRKL